MKEYSHSETSERTFMAVAAEIPRGHVQQTETSPQRRILEGITPLRAIVAEPSGERLDDLSAKLGGSATGPTEAHPHRRGFRSLITTQDFLTPDGKARHVSLRVSGIGSSITIEQEDGEVTLDITNANHSERTQLGGVRRVMFVNPTPEVSSEPYTGAVIDVKGGEVVFASTFSHPNRPDVPLGVRLRAREARGALDIQEATIAGIEAKYAAFQEEIRARSAAHTPVIDATSPRRTTLFRLP